VLLLEPTEVADRIARLVAQYGSDDKFCAAVNERLGTNLTRQTVIRWRTGKTAVSRKWAQRLAEFSGGRPEDFRVPSTWPEQVERRLAEIDRKLQELLRQRE
jgi:hypothetical protein